MLEAYVERTYESPTRGGQIPRHVPIVVLVDRDGGRRVGRGDETDALVHARLAHCPLYLVGDRDELVPIVCPHLDVACLHVASLLR
jgi:hypothetical protein